MWPEKPMSCHRLAIHWPFRPLNSFNLLRRRGHLAIFPFLMKLRRKEYS